MQVDQANDERSEKFHAQFNPMKLAVIRRLFLSKSNVTGGRYFARILKVFVL